MKGISTKAKIVQYSTTISIWWLSSNLTGRSQYHCFGSNFSNSTHRVFQIISTIYLDHLPAYIPCGLQFFKHAERALPFKHTYKTGISYYLRAWLPWPGHHIFKCGYRIYIYIITIYYNISNITCPWILDHVSLTSIFSIATSWFLILQLDPAAHLGPPTPSNSLTPLNLPLHFQLPPTNLSHREHTEARLLKGLNQGGCWI